MESHTLNLRSRNREYRGITGGECLDRVIAMKPQRVLDIGSGEGLHANKMRADGIDVTTISMVPPADYVGFDYLDLNFDDQPFDCIWASHVLEHVTDVGAFLNKCRQDLKLDGLLAVTVPPLKTPLVGGHVNLFTMETLCYNLILAGFLPKRIGSYGYNLSAICTINHEPLPDLVFDRGDIESLAYLFPVRVEQGSDGILRDHNW